MARGKQSDMWEHTAAKLCQYHNAHVVKENMMSIDFFHPLRAAKTAKVQVDASYGIDLLGKMMGLKPREEEKKEGKHVKLTRINMDSD